MQCPPSPHAPLPVPCVASRSIKHVSCLTLICTGLTDRTDTHSHGWYLDLTEPGQASPPLMAFYDRQLRGWTRHLLEAPDGPDGPDRHTQPCGAVTECGHHGALPTHSMSFAPPWARALEEEAAPNYLDGPAISTLPDFTPLSRPKVYAPLVLPRYFILLTGLQLWMAPGHASFR